jgi:nucleoid-associated protein YgaU
MFRPALVALLLSLALAACRKAPEPPAPPVAPAAPAAPEAAANAAPADAKPDAALKINGADLGTAVAPQKSGYNFTMGGGAGSAAGPNDCNGTATITAYLATGIPMTNGTTGTRSFAVNAGNTIWQNNTAAAPTEPFGAPATPIQ